MLVHHVTYTYCAELLSSQRCNLADIDGSAACNLLDILARQLGTRLQKVKPLASIVNMYLRLCSLHYANVR